MGYQHEDRGDPHETRESEEVLPREPPAVTKRTPRILHESSFATSAFTSSRSQSRPPGFIASSLDFKSSAAGSVVAPKFVTTKPGRNQKKSEKQSQEQLERERQYQQQRYRSGHPTRAQGNFGPPPHSVKSLEDLENMTEEEIYKLFMDDPELHQAFIKATRKESKVGNAPNAAPVGAKKGRSSARRKPSNSSKSKRRNTAKNIRFKDDEKEIPYFQWLFLLFIVGALLYKARKSYSIPTKTKNPNRTSRNSVARIKKKKQGGKLGKKSVTKNIVVEEKVKTSLLRHGVETDKKRSSHRRRRNKKPSKIGPAIVPSSISDEYKEGSQVGKQNQQHEPDLDSTDGSSGNNDQETSKFDLVVHSDAVLMSSSITSENDQAWQTVTKSSKGGRKNQTTVDPTHVEEKKGFNQPTVDDKGDGDIVSEPKTQAKKHFGEKSMTDSDLVVKEIEKQTSSADEQEKTDSVQTTTAQASKAKNVVEENEMTSEVKDLEEPGIHSEGKSANTIEDDAALALQLHEEEVNLVRSANGIPQEEEWEEVTVKKRKGNKP